MGKEEVENFLRQNKTFVNAKHISTSLNKTLSSTNRILNSMINWKEVKCVKRKVRIGKMPTARNVRYFKWLY